jgi:hypothetical protein
MAAQLRGLHPLYRLWKILRNAMLQRVLAGSSSSLVFRAAQTLQAGDRGVSCGMDAITQNPHANPSSTEIHEPGQSQVGVSYRAEDPEDDSP